MARKVDVGPPSDTPKAPGPGMHEGVPFELYQQWPLLNQSTLKAGLVSAEHLKAALDGRMAKADTDAQRLGRAFHCRLLEPDKFAEEWSYSEGCQAVVASGKRKGETCAASASLRTVPQADGEEPVWYCGQHAKGKDVEQPQNFLTWDQMDDIDAMCSVMVQHPVIKLLRSQGGCEVSVVGELDGFPAKARLDKWIAGGVSLKRDRTMPPTIVDLKKARIGYARTDRFANSMRDYGYDIQAAWYTDLVQAVAGVTPMFIWVVVEEQYPYSVNVLAADHETVEFGRKRYKHLLELMRRCRTTGVWPGYMESEYIQSVGLPRWFIERETERMARQ